MPSSRSDWGGFMGEVRSELNPKEQDNVWENRKPQWRVIKDKLGTNEEG